MLPVKGMKMNMHMRTHLQQRSRWRQTFLMALGIATVIFLPFIIFDGGYFIYYGDFNVQQIPFYKLAHEAVRSGNLFWNWNTDLGANFVGSYSFYLLFSPFFWLTLPFPTSWIPLLMAPLIILKMASCAMFAYFYIERFVKDNRYALLGGLLYAFSGWILFDVFFNHFLDVAVFFPLLLLGLEQLVLEDKKALFAFAVFLNAIVNYWFFIGEVVFVVMYFLVRMTDRKFRFRVNLKRFMLIAFEAVLGAVCSAVCLLPSVLALMGNPRTSLDELLSGWNVWLYWHEQRQPAILQSLFFPPELAARPNFFPDHGAKWSSLSAWLPMFGMVGVVAYFIQRKNSWVKKILVLSLVAALVPAFNSLFILLNGSYYARWFYMPILIMAVATVCALEDSAYDLSSFKISLKWCAICTAFIAVACGLTPNFDEDGKLVFGLAADLPFMWAYVAFAAACLAITAIVVLTLRRKKYFVRVCGASMAFITVVFSIFYIASGKNNYDRSRYVIDTAITGRYALDLPQDTFARADAFDAMDNILMFWNLPNIQAFHSIVPASIMEFYPEVGVKRDVGSRPESDYYALRPLLSVRWLFIQYDKENQEPMPGYEKYSEQLGFNIYENKNFIPMGFAYDRFIDMEEFESFSKNLRDNVLLKAVILDEEAFQRNKDILSTMAIEPFAASEEILAEDSAARREFTVDNFSIDNFGFSASSNFDETKFIFFSVPFERGWSAKINGESVRIEKANIGFMAVRVPAGHAEIRFDYMTPGLVEGAIISGVFLIILIAYAFMTARQSKKIKRDDVDVQAALFAGETVYLSAEEYHEKFNKKERRENLQRAINEAAARDIDAPLPDAQQNLRFVIPGEDKNTD